jgi:hypothetical protein
VKTLRAIARETERSHALAEARIMAGIVAEPRRADLVM